MKREIKFRFWNSKNKEWENEYSMAVGPYGVCDYVSGWDEGEFNLGNYSHIIPIQYTGLRDCKGVEIYEGDIVKCDYGEDGVVTFNDNNFAGIPAFHVCDKDGHSVEYHYGQKADKNCEVVGNIYENPELLTK